MRILHREVQAAGIDIVESVDGNTWRPSRSLSTWRPESLDEADLIALNGEGTMHDNGRMPAEPDRRFYRR